MFGRFRNSWELVKESWAVLQSQKELVVFPIASLIGVVIVSIGFFVPMLGAGLFDQATRNGRSGMGIATFIVLFLFYVVIYTVIIFANSALVGAVMIKLKGGTPTLSDGIAVARQRLGVIVGYAIIAATVGMILQALSSSARSNKNLVVAIISSIVISLVGMAWNLATFLAVPVLVVEDVGPIEAIKRSAALLRQTWGEQVIGNAGIGMVFGLLTFGVILLGGLLVGLFASISSALAILAVILLIVAVAAISVVGSTLSIIYRSALYRYAAEGKVELFQPELIQGAFRPV
jgi:hypothetical protein